MSRRTRYPYQYLYFTVCFCLAGWGFPIVEGHAAEHVLRGLLEPSAVIELRTQVPGIIEEVPVERGDHITKGQVLVRLKSGVEKAQADLAQTRFEFGKRKVQRNAELYKKQLLSSHEKDEMETELRIAELQFQEATEKLRLRTILSPINGVVVKRALSPGDYAGEGQGQGPIMTIARIDPINVELVVPVSLYKSIRKGMEATVRPEKPAGVVYRGKVVIVDEVIDAASGTFGVRIELPNPSGSVSAGLNCQVRILTR
ncbi:MAG: efflux RND transporter periplasmic adaptor subunit [Deltaproteobacteria bacterium HGW-Deltaproteobacteria-6]|nr:MAG: efflux RND transporter periplasmic adaptor subunit [Deltaproteobacteria bacterium HGW-Deltaproteobacteria-6]